MSDLENLVLAKLAAHSKPFASGKGGLDAEEIGRVIGPVGSRVLIDVLFSLRRKKLLLCVHTDEHDQHRKLYYLVGQDRAEHLRDIASGWLDRIERAKLYRSCLRRHSEPHIVELEDGSAGRIWPGGLRLHVLDQADGPAGARHSRDD